MSSKRGSVIKKAQYYVWYLGWKECRGLGGREFTEPIAKQMIARRRGEVLPKLTIEVSKKELKIVQLVDTKKGKIDKVKYPPVQARDVTYSVQTLSPDEDVVSCIYLGYNPTTQGAVHVHVYRCDSVETASLFVEHLQGIISLPEHMDRARRIEQELVAKGQVVPRPHTIREDDDDDQESVVGREDDNVFPSSPKPVVENSNNATPVRGMYTTEPPRAQQSPRIAQQSPRIAQQSPRVAQQSPRIAHQSPRISSDGGSGTRSPVVDPRKHPQMFPGTRGGSDNDVMYGNQGFYRQTSQDDNKIINENDYRKLDEETASQYDSLAEELRRKLGKKPLLLPPKDYDTINRSRGNQFDERLRHCKNSVILAKSGQPQQSGERLESSNTDSARGDSENSQDGDVDAHSPQDPSPRSLKSSGRFSAGFFENNRDDDVDAELAAIAPTISDPAFFQPDRPFSPGPNTHDLRAASYFPDQKNPLPGYMPHMPHGGGRPAPAQQQGYSPRGSVGAAPGGASRTLDRDNNHSRGSAKYSASSLGLAAGPPPSGGRMRSFDEGYTSLERGVAPPPQGYHSQMDISRAGDYRNPSAHQQQQQPGHRHLRRSEDLPPGPPQQPQYEEPPIDYTIAVRKHPQRSRPSFR